MVFMLNMFNVTFIIKVFCLLVCLFERKTFSLVFTEFDKREGNKSGTFSTLITLGDLLLFGENKCIKA